MAEKELGNKLCPNCSSYHVRVVSQHDNLRSRLQTGNFQTDMKPVSTTLTYQCQEEKCGHQWSETNPL